MKLLSIITLLIVLVSCSSEKSTDTNKDSESKKSIVTEFIKDVSSLEEDSTKNPIETFIEEAPSFASKTVELSKENIAEALETAKEFKNTVIVVGNHTIVKITDFKDCLQSGSWGACMPKAQGYIKRGELESKDDYINNLIGRPSDGSQTMYLFE